MAIELNAQQSEALRRESDIPVAILDPQSQRRYVLLPAQHYEQVRALFEDAVFDLREPYPAQERVALAVGWDSREMDEYNDYDAHRE